LAEDAKRGPGDGNRTRWDRLGKPALYLREAPGCSRPPGNRTQHLFRGSLIRRVGSTSSTRGLLACGQGIQPRCLGVHRGLCSASLPAGEAINPRHEPVDPPTNCHDLSISATFLCSRHTHGGESGNRTHDGTSPTVLQTASLPLGTSRHEAPPLGVEPSSEVLEASLQPLLGGRGTTRENRTLFRSFGGSVASYASWYGSG
jgi:hypothetical protein